MTTKMLYDLSNDILDKIFYKNNFNNKNLAHLIMAHNKFKEFINIKYEKLYLTSFQELQININDYSNIYEVDIFNCLGIIDTHIFKNCKILKLRCCHNITDVSQLGKVEYLDLAACNEIKNVSMLDKCKYLDLSNCNKITDVSALGNVTYLDLSHCDKISDISKLGNHKYLSLRGCNKISQIKNLNNVYKLDLSYCENILDISHLTNVYNLDVSYCPNIKINKIINTKIFHAISTNLLNKDIIFLENVIELNIRNCYWIRDLSILNNLIILDIRACKNIKKLPNKNTLKKINISKELYNNNSIFKQINYIEDINVAYFHLSI